MNVVRDGRFPRGVGMSSPRWDRLAASLHAAGHTVQVDQVPFAGGASYRMTIRVEAGLVEIRDAWWRTNDRVWIGWQGWLEGADALTVRELRPTKMRAAVVAFVRDCSRLAAPAVTR